MNLLLSTRPYYWNALTIHWHNDKYILTDSILNKYNKCFPSPELKEETNRTRCLLELDHNSLLVYKFQPASEADTKGSVRIIAIERQGIKEAEVQVWKTVEGKLEQTRHRWSETRHSVVHTAWSHLLKGLEMVRTPTSPFFTWQEVCTWWRWENFRRKIWQRILRTTSCSPR